MKKFSNLAYTGAIALASVFGLSACSSDSVEQAVNNPNFNPETNEVLTKFVLNVSSADNGQKMTTDAVQMNSNFRGMQDASFYTYKTDGTARTFLSETDAATAADKFYDLGTLYTSDALGASIDSATNKTSKSRRVLDLSLPLQTDIMLIYAKAQKNATGTIADQEFGKSIMTTDKNATNTEIKTVSILNGESEGTDATASDYLFEQYIQTLHLAVLVLNRVMGAEVAAQTATETHSIAFQNTTTHTFDASLNLPALSWSTLGNIYAYQKDGQDLLGNTSHPEWDAVNLAPLSEELARAYYEMMTIKSEEYRAGSAAAVSRMVYDLYSIGRNIWKATATSAQELAAQRLAFEIWNRMDYYFEFDDSGKTAMYKEVSNIAARLQTVDAATAADFAAGGKFGKVTSSLLDTYPVCFGMPQGVSQLYVVKSSNTQDSEKPGTRAANAAPFNIPGANYSYTTAEGELAYALPPKGMTVTTERFDCRTIMFPPELMYFTNSNLRLNTASKEITDYPDGVNPWDTESNWTGWTEGKVTSATNAVAVKKNINYGVSMLETRLTTSVTAFKDNKAAYVTGESDADVLPANIRLTGVLVGGQPKTLNWQYLTKDGANTYTVYDKAVGDKSGSEWQGKLLVKDAVINNFTLLYDNWVSGTQANSVKIALEFKNEGTSDFWGKHNVIRAGGTFYLVAELNLANANGTAIAWDNYYQVPPLNQSTGESTKESRIFVQDHTTRAFINLKEDVLKEALVSVPDLRSAQMSLGLSVDITWQTGLSFSMDLDKNP